LFCRASFYTCPMATPPVPQVADRRSSVESPVCGWKLERAARRLGFTCIAGLDEVGRGPLFGPVVAAAVILPKKCNLDGLTDSKKLSEKKREEFDLLIRATAVAWTIAAVDAETIDRINIRQASLLAMRLAVQQLAVQPDYLLIDGVDTLDDIPWPCSQPQGLLLSPAFRRTQPSRSHSASPPELSPHRASSP